MSDQSSNAPMMTAGSPSFFQTWINALTKPDEKTYSEIAASPNAKATTAYLWVFLSFIVTYLITFLVGGATIRDRFGLVGAWLVNLLCYALILAAIGTLFFAIDVAINQWIAKMFGGKGTFDQMAYTFASISVPYSLVSSVFILLSAIPFVDFFFRILIGLAGLYILVLEIIAVKGVNQFGWGAAVGSLFIPGLVVGIFCCCLLIAFGAAMGSSIGNIFSTINQSLNP